ncbi:probable serine/threonine-protein kinase mps1 isoform X2 [Papaver somniferum]|uniref:probable serine/threonine-protein kinase mps1 isoform X2 n=1 Tax=Papaver somniferum TaxID=3469 RepID=UPI000E6F468C|nr:probable serine/threonine-protein kinase mps1 isoform X2 [Papaver somniferum]
MEREANLPTALTSSSPSKDNKNLADTHTSRSSITSSSNNSQDYLRDVQAALKRHRPLCTMQSSSIQPRRIFLPQRQKSRPIDSIAGFTEETDKSQDLASSRQSNTAAEELIRQRNSYESSTNPPPITGTFTSSDPNDNVADNNNNVPQNISMFECQNKKVQFYLDEKKMDYDVNSHVEMSADHNYNTNEQHSQKLGILERSTSGISSLLAKRSMLVQDQQHQFAEFVGKNPIVQSSVVESSCATTTSVHSRSAPMLSSTTYEAQCRGNTSHMEIENVDTNPQAKNLGFSVHPPCSTSQSASAELADQPTQASISAVETSLVHHNSKGQPGCALVGTDGLKDGVDDHAKGSSIVHDSSIKEKVSSADITDVQSQAPQTKSSYSDARPESSNPDKPSKSLSGKGSSAPRKKGYNPDVFFKVNGTLYQKLGKIGSGGSSEVHKVITSDCTIYALKKIKLKGRDYSTAFGFCQEIEYLNKLKGRKNIIQLIDYEMTEYIIRWLIKIVTFIQVTDKSNSRITDKILLKEVLNGAMSIKDGKIKDDGYVYMVLEYGEIDLAHMLSHEWKEMERSNLSMDENWLRFYWKQILQAVNTIHEERIVHSDLKPANFLLVRGSLKLIDFGIAKAINNDTTNIQRDSQAGTVSYMSPEAFMCNETDSDGNAIKCGRPSDIWSLGCILYQMVYGRTPFAEYKTFFTKFKAITDRNHEIPYGPVSNPLLIDLMKKCLAWDRNERWRIPQLLQHPFLVPPIPTSHLSCPQLDPRHKLQEASRLCSQILNGWTDTSKPLSSLLNISSASQEKHSELILQFLRLGQQIEHLNIGKDVE